MLPVSHPLPHWGPKKAGAGAGLEAGEALGQPLPPRSRWQGWSGSCREG